MPWSKRHLLKIRENMYLASASLPDDIAYETPELFPDWAIGVEYAIGVRVRYYGTLYKCVQAHTSQVGWEPNVAVSLWVEVAEPGEIPVWRQPTGAQDAYMAGDRVHYPGREDPVYESSIDYNVYSPDVYGWVLIS